jgi:hypothetical protein
MQRPRKLLVPTTLPLSMLHLNLQATLPHPFVNDVGKDVFCE